MRPFLLPLTAALTLCGTGCGPSLPFLLAAHRFDEAICLDDDGSYSRPRDPQVMRAIEAELRPTVQIHAVTPEEIDAVFAKADSDVRARAHEETKRVFILRARLATQKAPVHQAWMYDSLRRGHEGYYGIIGEDKLADFFHERLASSHTEGPGVIGTLSAWQKDVVEHPIANALTLGIWSALTGPSAPSTSVGPTDEERLKAAPLSRRLSLAFPGYICGRDPGTACETESIYERPGDEGRMPFTVQVSVNLEAYEEGGLFTRSRTCTGGRSVEVKLPPGGTMEERFAARFGDRVYSLSELDH